MRVDKGGIKFVMGGANVMAPGLLNPGIYLWYFLWQIYSLGGEMDDVEAGKVVVRIYTYELLA